MNAELDPLVADRHFFASLIDANLPALDQILADDFILIDVMSGSEITKSSLLAVMGSGQVRFESIEPGDNLMRPYTDDCRRPGRTRMKGRLEAHRLLPAAATPMCSLCSKANGVW